MATKSRVWTAAQWQTCAEPEKMLRLIRGKGRSRKLRLFACACCRRAWKLLRDRRSREAVTVAERQADKQAGQEEVAEAEVAADDVWSGPPGGFSEAEREAAYLALACLNPDAFRAASEVMNTAIACREYSGDDQAERAALAALLRDLVRPFDPLPAVEPAWLTWNDGVVLRLAESIYEARGWDRLPVLADALEEAGCDNAEILEHVRGVGPHVRGCWVLDLLTGRA